ncbi:DUF2141 domain-containing protein [Phenylobacterium sp. J367]|uniref:DUF2141 domain-containing protein n=1 Tax=Phenylobacterium sp. J367 TaxID=2898435 RepID=UPI0021517873|nr:DUF2141 domain-containing protein [Phenylobacterium sp. J367]MCR5880404.1 DUF2141 domain-containing protein [Phenylobacterium sp. J367]
MKARMAAMWVAAIGAAILPITARAQDSCAGAAEPGFVRLTVRAQNVQSSAGEVAFTLYPNIKRRFLAAGGKLLRTRVKAQAGTTSACFWVAPGAYALAVYHDADGDRDFDRSRLGSPVEGFAFSNNPPTRFGLPAFEAARFDVGPEGRQLAVQMRYLRADLSR